MKKFELGCVVMTLGVFTRMDTEPEFERFVHGSLRRFADCDWGDTCPEDRALDDEAVKNDERILAVYNYKSESDRIWIITEWDRSATTILFLNEY